MRLVLVDIYNGRFLVQPTAWIAWQDEIQSSLVSFQRPSYLPAECGSALRDIGQRKKHRKHSVGASDSLGIGFR